VRFNPGYYRYVLRQKRRQQLKKEETGRIEKSNANQKIKKHISRVETKKETQS